MHTTEHAIDAAAIAPAKAVTVVAKADPGWTRARFWALYSFFAVFGVLLRIEALWTPWILDDYMQIGMQRGQLWAPRPAWDLFNLVSGNRLELHRLLDAGALPWWTDPGLRIATLRPIASLANALEFSLFGPKPMLAHAISLGLWALMAGAVVALYRTLLEWRAAWFAFAVYVFCRAHDVPIGWIANRSVIFATLFGALALRGHVRYREQGDRAGLWQSLLGLVLSLASAEYGLGTFGFLIAYEWQTATRGKLRALLPPALIGVGYVLVHCAMQRGAHATDLYVDPVSEPARFLHSALHNLPILLAQVIWPMPYSGASSWLGVLFVVALLWLLVPKLSERARTQASGLAVAGFLATLPLAASAIPNARLLGLAEIGFAGALGIVLGEATLSTDRVQRVAWSLLFFVHGFVAPGLAVAEMHYVRTTQSRLDQAAVQAPLSARSAQDVILIAAVDVFSLHYPPMARAFAGLPRPSAWWVLSTSSAPHRLRRVAKDALELECLGPGFLQNGFANAYRQRSRPLRVGDVVQAGRIEVTILAVGEHGPTRARFRFPEDLDDSRLVTLTSRSDGYHRLALPPVGSSIWLPPASSSDDAALHN